MRAFNRLMLAAGIVLAGAAAARGAGVAGANDVAYDIRIQRPLLAGQAFGINATNTLRSSEKVDLPSGVSSKNLTFRRVTLAADIRIDKVDMAGVETAVSVVIGKLTLESGEGTQTQAKAVLEPGTELTLTYPGGQATFTLKKGGALADDAQLALLQGFKRMSITDAVYGTKEKKKVGDTWELNKSAMGGDRTSPQYVDPALVSGSVALKGVRKLLEIECLQLEGSMTTKDFQVQGVAAKEATMTAVFTANVPVDGAKPTVAWSVRSTVHFVTEESPLGRGVVRRTVDTEITHEAAWTPKP